MVVRSLTREKEIGEQARELTSFVSSILNLFSLKKKNETRVLFIAALTWTHGLLSGWVKVTLSHLFRRP